jgi:Kef-type K+ transport system membrane component KefB
LISVRLLVGLFVLGLVTLVGSKTLQARWRLPIPVKRLFDSGLIFLIVGMAIGPSGVRLVNESVLEQTGPIVVFCLGWIGFLFGVHLEARRLRRLSARMWSATLAESLITFGLVLGGAWVFFTFWCPDCQGSTEQKWAALITLAVCASGTAPASVFMLGDRPLFRGDIAQAIRVAASLDDLPGLLVFGFLFAMAPLNLFPALGPLSGVLWAVLSVVIGAVLGLLMRTLTQMAGDDQVNLLVLMGLVAFGAGAATFIHLSPIFVGAVAGVTFANTSGHKEVVFEMLARSEHTIYVLFLVLVGCEWRIESVNVFALTALYLAVRAFGKVGGGLLGAQLIKVNRGRQRLGGLALLGQGGLAIAMAVNYSHVYESPITPTVVTVLILGVIINELVGPLAATVPFGPPRVRRRRS